MKLNFRDILFIIIFGFIVVNCYLFFDSKDKTSEKVKIVDNSTPFYDVVDIVNRYLNSSSDAEKIILMLDKNYVKKKRINKDNVFSTIKKIDNNHNSFSSDKMYYKKISNKLTKYYVSGDIVRQDLDGEYIEDKIYLIVQTDSKNNTFSIIPIDKKSVKEVEKNVF